MVVVVSRHTDAGGTSKDYARALEDGLAKGIRGLTRSSERFSSQFDTAMECVGVHLLGDPTGSMLESWEAIVIAMQISFAGFAAAVTPPGEVAECRIAHEVHSVPAAHPALDANPENWLNAFWLAIVCRDQHRMDRLAEIPLNLLHSESSRCDEYIYHWIDSLQAYWLQRPGLPEKLTAAIEASYPDRARDTDRELLDSILYSPIDLFHRFFRGDHEGFNESLLGALYRHRSYWTADDERAGSVAGVFALAPLAITCLAFDAGFPIEVESDYLPRHFLHRSWLREFDT